MSANYYAPAMCQALQELLACDLSLISDSRPYLLRDLAFPDGYNCTKTQ